MDQLTKAWAISALSDGPISLIGDFLQLRLTFNPGAAFSSFTGGGRLLAVIAVIVSLSIVFILPRLEHRREVIALSLVLGGALGNFADRVFRADGLLDGAVVDFIDFSFWPTFNAADSAISIGVVLMMLAALFTREPVA